MSETSPPLIEGIEILKLLEGGSSEAIFQARQTLMDRIVAVKVQATELIATERQLKKLQRQARISSALKHKNDPAPLLSERAPQLKLSLCLARLIGKCLAKHPRERPRSAILRSLS